MADPLLRNLPFKIELNRFGQILMSPASVHHGVLQSRLAHQMQQRRRDGVVITECPIQTSDGVRVADVAWASRDFMARHGKHSPLRTAPEICCEVVSRSNSAAEIAEKASLYFERGAHEVWVVRDDGSIRYLDPAGERRSSDLIKRVRL